MIPPNHDVFNQGFDRYLGQLLRNAQNGFAPQPNARDAGMDRDRVSAKASWGSGC